MKSIGLLAASVVALVAGAQLVLAAFAPVLPPDFDRRWDPGFANAYRMSDWYTHRAAAAYNETGVWPRDVSELLWSERDEAWWERNPKGYQSWIEDVERYVTIVRSDTVSAIEYRGAFEAPPTATCVVEIDAAYATESRRWLGTPQGRRALALPDHLDLWSRSDCRRLTGVRAWLSWTGLDRYRQKPPERYAPLTYAERAWERSGIIQPSPLDGR